MRWYKTGIRDMPEATGWVLAPATLKGRLRRYEKPTRRRSWPHRWFAAETVQRSRERPPSQTIGRGAKEEVEEMKPNKKATQLLNESFTRNGQISCSGIHTDIGTLPLWGQLVRCGLVQHMSGTLLGHNFSFELTDSGREFLEGSLSQNETIGEWLIRRQVNRELSSGIRKQREA